VRILDDAASESQPVSSKAIADGPAVVSRDPPRWNDPKVHEVLDLDRVAAAYTAAGARWADAGFRVGPLTWRDRNSAWPQPIVENRQVVDDPESGGLRARRGDAEIEVVIWSGGWADAAAYDLQRGESLLPPSANTLTDLDACQRLLDDLFEWCTSHTDGRSS
jgi:hypothetical protein